MKPPLLAVVALLSLHAPALATEAKTPAPVAKAPSPASAPTASPAARHDGELSADMEVALRKAGFSDLHVMPNAVFVRAKDKAGNPVAMVLDPQSMTEMITLDPHSGPAALGNGAAPTLTGSGTFAAALPSQKLASALIGTPVVDGGGDKIGTIKDLVIDHGGVHAYVVGVGGLLGLGDRYVAVTPGALVLAYDVTAKSYRATMSATKAQLSAAPEFKFEDLAAAKRD